MKLFFDENLPPSLAQHLATDFSLSITAKSVGLDQCPDQQLWQYAKEHGFIIATRDVHFYRFCVARGHPPKIVWVRIGNCSVASLIDAFRRAKPRLETFQLDDRPFLILK